MLLHVGNAWAKLISAGPEELKFVKKFLSYRSVSHTGKAKELTLLRKDMFPAGLAARLVRVAREFNYTVEVAKRTQQTEIGELSEIDTDWVPRDHQAAAIEVIRSKRRGLVQHATGGGKSDLIGLLAALIKGRVLIIATSKKLQEDLVKRCLKFGVKPGQVGSGLHDTSKRVTVCNDDSLKRLTKSELLSYSALLCDEVHHGASATHQKALMQCVNADIRLGFSATALDRSDKKGLFIVGALGDTIHVYTQAQAVKDGAISAAKLRMPRFVHTTVHGAGDYTDWEQTQIAQNSARNLMVVRLVASTDAPRIVFVRTKLHQQKLVELIGDCVWVNDETPTDKADQMVRDLCNGVVGTLVSTPIYRQGIDIPQIKTVINAAGGKATIDVIQKVGRGSRILQPDGSRKETFSVYDVYDVGCGCNGELHKSCEWLHRHSEGRRAAYMKFGYKIEVE